jgi:hypothetical protein
MQPSAMRAPICWSLPNGPLSTTVTFFPQLFFYDSTCCSSGVELMLEQSFTVELNPFKQIRLFVVMRYKRDIFSLLDYRCLIWHAFFALLTLIQSIRKNAYGFPQQTQKLRQHV